MKKVKLKAGEIVRIESVGEKYKPVMEIKCDRDGILIYRNAHGRWKE